MIISEVINVFGRHFQLDKVNPSDTQRDHLIPLMGMVSDTGYMNVHVILQTTRGNAQKTFILWRF